MEQDVFTSAGITMQLASDGDISEKHVSTVDGIRSKRIKWLVQEHHSELTKFCVQRDREKEELRKKFKLDLDQILASHTDSATRNKIKRLLKEKHFKKLDLFDLHMKGQRKKLVAMQIDIMKKERETMDQLTENGRGCGLEELIEKFPYPKSGFILASFEQADDDLGDSNLLSSQKQDTMITLESVKSYDSRRFSNGISENFLPVSKTSLVDNLIPSSALNEWCQGLSRKTLQETVLNEHAEPMDTESSTYNFSTVKQVQPVLPDGPFIEVPATSARVSVDETAVLIETPVSQSKNTNSNRDSLVEMQFGLERCDNVQEKAFLDTGSNYNSHVAIYEASIGIANLVSHSAINRSDDIPLAGNITFQRPVHMEFQKHGNSDLNAENEPSTAKSCASVGAYDGNILGEENAFTYNNLAIVPNQEEEEGSEMLMETEPVIAISDEGLEDLTVSESSSGQSNYEANLCSSMQTNVENELGAQNPPERAYNVHKDLACEIPAVVPNQQVEEISTGCEATTATFGARQKDVIEDSDESANLSNRTGPFQSSEQGAESVETDGVCLTSFPHQNPASTHALNSPDFSNPVSAENISIMNCRGSAPNGTINNISSTTHGCEVHAVGSVNVLSSSVVPATGIYVNDEASHLHLNPYDELLSDVDHSSTIQHGVIEQHIGGQPRSTTQQSSIPMQQIHPAAVQAQPHLAVSQSFTFPLVFQPNILPERLNSEELSRCSMPLDSARISAPILPRPQFNPSPLEYELLQIRKQEQICTARHKSKMEQLRMEHEKEVAVIKKKYEDLLQTYEHDFSRDKEILKVLTKKVNMQKDLATKFKAEFFKDRAELMRTSQVQLSGHVLHPSPVQMPDATLQRSNLSAAGTQSLPLPLINIHASTSTVALKSSNVVPNQTSLMRYTLVSTCGNQSVHAHVPFPRSVTGQTRTSGMTIQQHHSFTSPDLQFRTGSSESQSEPASLHKDPVVPSDAMFICLSDEE